MYLYFHCFASKRRRAPRLETVWIPDRRAIKMERDKDLWQRLAVSRL